MRYYGKILIFNVQSEPLTNGFIYVTYKLYVIITAFARKVVREMSIHKEKEAQK